MFRWRHPVSAISGLMSAVAERIRKGGKRRLPHPALWRMCAPVWGAVSMSSAAGLVLQVRDSFVSAHVLISHELLDAVGVHIHVFLAAQGTDFSTDTVGDFTLNAVAHV